MPVLQFKGKTFVQNHHLQVKYHELIPVKAKSLTDKVTLHDNLIIHGDNLKALKALLPLYAGKIKCIYIDPPYNTGNEGWAYNDNVNSPMIDEWLGKVVDREDLTRHDKWLCMMMPRLKLLRELLRDDGIICISIDDNEFNDLITLCNEVFGEINRLGVIVIRNNPRGRRLGTEIAVEHEYLIVYARTIEKFKAGRLELNEEQLAEYSEIDKNGRRFRLLGLRKRGALAKRKDRPNLHYPLFANPTDGSVGTKEARGLMKVIPRLSNNTDGVWRWSRDKVDHDSNLLMAKLVKRRESGEKEWDIFQIDYPDNEEGEIGGRLFPSIWQGSEFNNETGRDQIRELFGKIVFEYPKPLDLIKHAILLSGDKTGIILDSFAGSGTTGQATLELNASDGGERKFLMVECEDYADRVSAERVRRVIKAGTPGQFSFFHLGKAIELESILEGDGLPTYEELARYVFYTATGEEFDEETVDEEKHFVGESQNYQVFLFYVPDVEKLKNLALTLDMAKALPPLKKDKKRLVFAPTKYLDQDHLDQYRIDFAQLPYEIYELTR